jgi:hypothetical protein
MAGIIIASEFAIVALVLFFFIQRRRNLTPATVAAFVDTQPVQEIPVVDEQYTAPASHDYRPPPTEPTHSKVIWDDILHTKMQQGKPFKTHLEIIGGKIIIPGDSKSTDIELINSPDSRVLISLEYEPETLPKGITKIMILEQYPNMKNQRRPESEKGSETMKLRRVGICVTHFFCMLFSGCQGYDLTSTHPTSSQTSLLHQHSQPSQTTQTTSATTSQQPTKTAGNGPSYQ